MYSLATRHPLTFEAVVFACRRQSAFKQALISHPSKRAAAWESIPFHCNNLRLSTIFHVLLVIHFLAGRSLRGANYVTLELRVCSIKLQPRAPGKGDGELLCSLAVPCLFPSPLCVNNCKQSVMIRVVARHLDTRYKKPGSNRATLRDGHYTNALAQQPLSPYWEKCGAMGCGILYRMMAEWFGQCATLATHRMG
jgi:hypothetical protein